MLEIRLPLALCSCLCLSTACTKSSPEPESKAGSEAEDANAQAPGSTPRAVVGTGANLIQSQDLAKLYPGDAIAVAAFAAPERLFTLFGRDTIVEKLGPYYAEASAEIKAVVGQDLLTPEGIRALGIDPGKPVGMFFWSVDDESGGGFVGLSDRDLFLASVKSIAERAGGVTFETHEVGDATILCPEADTEVCLTVTKSHAYLAGSGTSDEVGLQVAKRLAALTTAQSLAGDEAFVAGLAHLEGGADVAGYVDLRPIVERGLRDLGAQETERDKAQAALMSEIFGPMQAVVFGGDFETRAFAGQVFVHTKGSSLLTQLAKNGARVNPVITAMGGDTDVVVLGAYTVDPAALWSFVEKVAAADGEDLDDDLDELRTLAGIDLKEQVLPAISGEFGLGIKANLAELVATAAEGGPANEAKLAAAVDGAAMIGFTDAARAEALLTKIFGNPLIGAFVTRDDQRDLWSLSTPIDKTVLFSIASPAEGSPYLAIATQPQLLAQVKSGTAPAPSGEVINPDYAEFLGRSDVAGIYAARQAAMSVGMWAGFAGMSMDFDVGPEPGNEPEDPEYRKKRAELQGVEEQLREVRREQQQQMTRMMRDIFGPWGVSAVSLSVVPDGFDLRGGQFIDAPTWAELAASMVAAGVEIAMESEKMDARAAELYAREAQLREEMMQIAGSGVGAFE